MKSYIDCYPCFIKQAVFAGRIATQDEDLRWKILREVTEETLSFSHELNPAVMGMRIHRIVRRVSGNSDPYMRLKSEYNAKASRIENQVVRMIRASTDPLLTAIKMTIIGNIIDFGPAMHCVEDLEEFIEKNLSNDFCDDSYVQSFIDDLKSVESILYIADNCGEIVFDKIFIDLFLRQKKLYLGIRGSPVINDITKRDLEGIGFSDGIKIIENGSDAPGTILNECSNEFKDIFYNVDMVIAKGQGNFESLTDVVRQKMYSLLIAKCPVISHILGCDVGDFVLTRLGQ